MKPYLTDEELEVFKERSLQYEKSGFPKCDPLMIDVIKFFNQQKNITTVFSCEGHPQRYGVDRAYWLFATNQEGVSELENFFISFDERLTRQIKSTVLPARLSLKIKIHPTKFTRYPCRLMEIDVQYPNKEITHRVFHQVMLESFSSNNLNK